MPLAPPAILWYHGGNAQKKESTSLPRGQRDGATGCKRCSEAERGKFLSERRREKMDKAMKLARLAGLAGIAAAEFGLGEKEEGDV